MALYSWIYWVVTAILTSLVMLAWYMVSRVQRRRMVRDFSAKAAAAGIRSPGVQPTAISGFWTSWGAEGAWGFDREFGRGGLSPHMGHVRSSFDDYGCGGCGGCGGG